MEFFFLPISSSPSFSPIVRTAVVGKKVLGIWLDQEMGKHNHTGRGSKAGGFSGFFVSRKVVLPGMFPAFFLNHSKLFL